MIGHFPVPTSFLHRRLFSLTLAVALCAGICCHAQNNPASKPAANPEPDVLVLSNGDTLHGKLVSEMAGKVTFHKRSAGERFPGLGQDRRGCAPAGNSRS